MPACQYVALVHTNPHFGINQNFPTKEAADSDITVSAGRALCICGQGRPKQWTKGLKRLNGGGRHEGTGRKLRVLPVTRSAYGSGIEPGEQGGSSSVASAPGMASGPRYFTEGLFFDRQSDSKTIAWNRLQSGPNVYAGVRLCESYPMSPATSR